jgi:hypothetical protein
VLEIVYNGIIIVICTALPVITDECDESSHFKNFAVDQSLWWQVLTTLGT